MKSFGLITSGSDLILTSYISHGVWDIVIDPLIDAYKNTHPDQALNAVKYYINLLVDKGISKIIVGPRYEYMLKQDTTYQDYILPLYETYLHQHVLAYTLVGKLGFRGDQSDIDMINQMMHHIRGSFCPSDRQSAIHKFHHDLPIWTVRTDLQKELILGGYQKHRILNNIVKYDLHHFKDADVDTLIPLQYCYRHTEKILKHHFNTHKRRFHGGDTLSHIIQDLINIIEPCQIHYSHTIPLAHIPYRFRHHRSMTKGNILMAHQIESYFVSPSVSKPGPHDHHNP